jgi:hypothetical protein
MSRIFKRRNITRWRHCGRFMWRLEFKVQDLWIGAFWNNGRDDDLVDLWICVLPCLPIHLGWWKR